MHSELLARLEAATAEQQAGLLLEAWRAVWGSANCSVDACPEYRTFTRMVGLGAYESAALTLVPEGWAFRLKQTTRYDQTCWTGGGQQPAWTVSLMPDDNKADDFMFCEHGGAAPPALAIVIAAILAREVVL